MAKYKVTLKQGACIGCGGCAAICDKFWSMENGKSVLNGSHADSGFDAKEEEKPIFSLEISDSDFACNKEAKEACPVNAIIIEKLED